MTIKEYVKEQKTKLKNKIGGLKVPPCFAIIQVNDDEASNAYIRGKMKDAEELGIKCELIKLNPQTTQVELLKQIDKINNDPKYHGLIVQMPLPKGIDEEVIKFSIKPEKDIDGFHPLSSLEPCTPKGIINYLIETGVQIQGKNALIIGRSNIVGKPMAKLLLKQNANVTIVHSKTSAEDMKFYIEHADIVVVAVGRKFFLDERFNYRKDAIIIDVGINRVDSHLYGDAKPGLNVQLQTPVPGGVGLLTRLALINNLMEAYENEIFNN